MSVLFVYGTLKRNHRAHDLLENWNPEFLGEIRTTPKYHLCDLGSFPGMIINDSISGNGVKGELFEVSEDCLLAMDRYEGVNRKLYRRETIELADGSTAIAYIIVSPWNKDLVPDGEWTRS